ncbi:hypothetical protein [Rhodoferax sp. WC2427]|uniref:hypothetical protein n=1 Tax=Rhodoferax sp. WC2427 TaxID=3234144 RepID=UPI003466B70C
MINPLPSLDRTSATFKTDLDTFFLTQLPAFSTQAEAARVAINAAAVSASADADDADLSAAAALGSANAAAAYAGAGRWVTGVVYAADVVVWSPADQRLYRRIALGSGITDPSGDPSHWNPISIQSVANGGTGATTAAAARANLGAQVDLGTPAAARAALGAQAELGFVAGTRLLFAQAAAPTGWTRDVTDTANNRMLRVVASGGGGVGGTMDPTYCNVVASHTHGFSTGTMSADHSHGIGDPGHNHVSGVPYDNSVYGTVGISAVNGKTGVQAYGTSPLTSSSGTGVYTVGASANHTHSGGTDNGSSQTNWTPRYLDLIVCTKN